MQVDVYYLAGQIVINYVYSAHYLLKYISIFQNFFKKDLTLFWPFAKIHPKHKHHGDELE